MKRGLIFAAFLLIPAIAQAQTARSLADMRAEIDATMRACTNQCVTGPVLNTVLQDMLLSGATGSTLSSPWPISLGGTGTATPGLVAGSGISISGAWPNNTISATASGGSVTSVAATVPAYMTLAGSPITTTGTLAFGFGSETANLFFASPSGSSGVPSWRALVGADVPAINLATSGNGGVGGILSLANGGTGTASPSLVAGSGISISGSFPNQTVTSTASGGSVTSVAATVPAYMTLAGSPITTTGTLAFGFGSETANTVFAAPNGTSGAPAWRTLGGADVPAINLAASGNGGVTGNLPGAQVSGNIAGNAANVTGTVAVANGGTGTAAPSLVAGTNVTITGSWPNQTIAASGGGSASSTTPSQSGLTVVASGTTVTVAAKSMVVVNSSGVGFYVASPSVSCATGTAGLNGLDTGTIAANTWYAVYDVENGTTNGCLLSASFTAPTLPSGYTYTMRVGAVRYGASALVNTHQFGAAATYDLPVQMVTGSAIGSVSAPTWVAFSISGSVPPTAVFCETAIINTSIAVITMVAPSSAYGNYTSTTLRPPLVSSTSLTDSLSGAVTGYIYTRVSKNLPILSSNFYWATSGGTTYVDSYGWTDNL